MSSQLLFCFFLTTSGSAFSGHMGGGPVGDPGYTGGNGGGNGGPAGGDSDERCCFWAMIGECDVNPFWMRPNCQKSCGTSACTVENADECPISVNLEGCPWADKGTPQKPQQPQAPPMPEQPQAPPMPEQPPAPEEALPPPPPPPGMQGPEKPQPDMKGPETTQFEGLNAVEGEDNHENCCWWAQIGECDTNPFWMRVMCQSSCGTTGCTVEGADDCPVSVSISDDCPWKEGATEGEMPPRPEEQGPTMPEKPPPPVGPAPPKKEEPAPQTSYRA